MSKSNQNTRDAAIQAIVDGWIATKIDGRNTGGLLKDANFLTLYCQVQDLVLMTHTVRWMAGTAKWIGCIEYATEKFFTEEAGFDEHMKYALMNAKPDQFPTADTFTIETRRAYQRLFRWAVMQGATYAYVGNR